MALDFGILFGFWGIVGLAASGAVTVAGGVYALKIRRKREEEKRRNLRRPRNSLERYPSFIAGRINGVIALFPLDDKGKILPIPGRMDSRGRRLSEQHSIAIAVHPEIFSLDSVKEKDKELDIDNNNNHGGLEMKIPESIHPHPSSLILPEITRA